MASSAVSEILLFVAVLLIAGLVVSVLTVSSYKISLSLEKKSDSISNKLAQDFEIINDPADIPRNPTLGITTIYIKNTGKEPIIFTNTTFNVIIDGNIVSITDISPTTGILYPEEVGTINVSYNETGYHKIRVVSSSGVSREIIGYIQ
ncbi:flagellar protein G [Methanocaldococcus indicus]|uniref:flagellar protein G n=1 Tax=Methanocaldococcus indicus TaxID=213231 RepID=UPI003C6D057E